MPLKLNDAGHGWLMFAMPPLETAFHDSEKNDPHELFLMCDNLAVTLRDPHLRTQTSESIEGAGLKITAYTAIRLNKQNVFRQLGRRTLRIEPLQ